MAAYEQGIADINAALPAEDFIENNIIAALNKALAAMQAIPADHAGPDRGGGVWGRKHLESGLSD